MRIHLFLFFIAIPALVFAQPSDSTNEPESRLWYGYLGSIPNAPYGFAIGTAKRDRIGFFIAVKSNFKHHGAKDSDFYENVSENKARNIFGDRQTDEGTGSTAIEIGLTSRISTGFFFYVGLGYAFTKKYLQFYDRFEILGNNGHYWIQTDENSTINLNGGILFLVENGPYFQLGFDSSPGGFNVGIGLFSISSLF